MAVDELLRYSDTWTQNVTQHGGVMNASRPGKNQPLSFCYVRLRYLWLGSFPRVLHYNVTAYPTAGL